MKNLQTNYQERKGFTLIEVLIVMLIFSIVSLVAITTYLTSFRVGQRASIENAIIEDARFILGQITEEIKNGTIDYEEYFNQCVVGGTCPNSDLDSTSFASASYENYGSNHGLYAWQFKYGGKQSNAADAKDDGYGGICQNTFFEFVEYPSASEDDDEKCITGPLTFGEDIETGANPNSNWQGKTMIQANAFCSNNAPNSGSDGYQTFFNTPGLGITREVSKTKCPPNFYKQLSSYTMSELYLINAEGDKKTILAREQVNNNGDYALSKLEMLKNYDAETESQAPYRALPQYEFHCADDYLCYTPVPDAAPPDPNPYRADPYIYNEDESKNMYLNFVPISPLNVNIKSLEFIVFPVEDPHLAFAEVRNNFGSNSEPAIQIQPQVTILLEIEPSSQYKLPYISDGFNLRLQTTVSAGVTTEVPIVREL